MSRLKLMFIHLAVQLMAAIGLAGIMILLLAAPWWTWLFVPLGVAAQYLNEYNLHRFIFHQAPPKRQWAFDILYQAHYGHHDFPTNTGLFFVPVWIALPSLMFNFCLVWGIAAMIGVANAHFVAIAVVLVGGIGTFMAYEWFHMTAHMTVPKTRVERHVTTLHNQHHFRDFSRWFHVSPGGEVIDKVMGTAIDRETLKAQQRIDFIRTLGMRPDDPRLIAARTRFANQYGFSDAEIARAAVA